MGETWNQASCAPPVPATEQRNQVFQYAIELPNSSDFLGMPSRKHWIMYGQALDPYGIKNWLGFNLSRGTGEYASSTQFAEVHGPHACPMHAVHHAHTFEAVNHQCCMHANEKQPVSRCAAIDRSIVLCILLV